MFLFFGGLFIIISNFYINDAIICNITDNSIILKNRWNSHHLRMQGDTFGAAQLHLQHGVEIILKQVDPQIVAFQDLGEFS